EVLRRHHLQSPTAPGSRADLRRPDGRGCGQDESDERRDDENPFHLREPPASRRGNRATGLYANDTHSCSQSQTRAAIVSTMSSATTASSWADTTIASLRSKGHRSGGARH